MFTVIPAIDILDQSVVRLTQGDYRQVSTFDTLPEEIAIQFEQSGAKRIHLVDLNGAKDGKLTNLAVIKRIRNAVSCDIQVGGGIRSLESAQTLIDIGINYIILGSLLIKSPELSQSIITQLPHQVIAGLDLNHGQIATEGWQETAETPLKEVLKWLETLPISSIISTDIQKDGMMQGPGMQSLMNLSQQTTIPIIASGGVSSLDDIDALKKLYSHGIIGCIIGKALLTHQINLKEVLA